MAALLDLRTAADRGDAGRRPRSARRPHRRGGAGRRAASTARGRRWRAAATGRRHRLATRQLGGLAAPEPGAGERVAPAGRAGAARGRPARVRRPARPGGARRGRRPRSPRRSRRGCRTQPDPGARHRGADVHAAAAGRGAGRAPRAATSGSPRTTRSPVLPVDEPGYAIRTRLRFGAPRRRPTAAARGIAYNVAGRRRPRSTPSCWWSTRRRHPGAVGAGRAGRGAGPAGRPAR